MNSAAFFLYMVFMCSWFLHMPERLPVLGVIRFDLLLAGATFALTLMGGLTPARTPAETRVRRWLLLLSAYCVVTLPLVEWPGSVLRVGLAAFAKAALFYFFTVHLVSTERRLRILLGVFVACQSLRVFEPLYLHLTQGYWGSYATMGGWESMERLSGAPSDVINPNGLAFVILTVLSFSHFLMSGTAMRLAYLALLPLHLYTLVLTSSRSGFLGLLAVYAVVWWRSQHKVLLTTVALAVVLFSIPRLDENSMDRYTSIFSSDAKNAATAEGRLTGVRQNFEVALRRPLFGHGLRTSREANANFGVSDQPAHNLYAEAAQEIGFVGLLLLVGLIVSIGRNTSTTVRAFKAMRHQPTFLSRVANALQVFLAMNLLFSLASYGLTSYEWYLMAGLSEVLARLALRDQAPGLTSPADRQSPRVHGALHEGMAARA